MMNRQKIELKKVFRSTKSVDKMLKVFKKMEKLFPESELGIECWKLADLLHDQGNSPEQVLSFGNRALRIFIDNDSKNIPFYGNNHSGISSTATGIDRALCTYCHKSSFYIAHICNLLAFASCELKRYNESLSYLNWANRNLTTLLEANDGDTACVSNCLLSALLATQKRLYLLKYEMGRFDEVVDPLRKVLDIEQLVMEEDCIQLGKRNGQVCGTYMMVMNYEEALPFCLKAIEIYTKHLGSNSMEVALTKMHLAYIYNDMKEYEKALEHIQVSHTVVKKMNRPELMEVETGYGMILIGLGRYEEANDILKFVVSQNDIVGRIRVLALVSMGKAFCYLEKLDVAKKCMIIAQRILEKMGKDPVNAAIGFRDVSRLCEMMNDFENAISLLRRALSIPQIPLKLLAESSARLFSLISLSSKEDKGIAYMEDLVEKLKEKFGEEHCEVGHGYRNLGATYLKSGQEELAVQFMVKAKDIMDVTLGPHHVDSLKTSQTLAETYADLRRHDLAIEIQERVVEGFEVLEPREQEFLDMAGKLLNKMKEKALESPTRASPQSKDDRDLSAKISKCVISDDEKVLD